MENNDALESMIPLDRETRMLQALAPYARKVPRKTLTTVNIDYATRKSSIVFMLIPEWATTFPPYNLARLSAITKHAGYETHVFDVNQLAHAERKSWNLDFDPWHPAHMPKWFGGDYYKNIHPHIEKLLLKYVAKIVELNPTAVGFTLYDCNKTPVEWFIIELRKHLPNIITIGGGGICNRSEFISTQFDYIASGEGEQLILDILEDIEKEGKPAETKRIVQAMDQRINLDTLPLPDYSHFDLNSYDMSNGVAMELSRGCIAKCTFCDETHYWKYRDRMSNRVLDEIIALNETGVTLFWFIDSLVNGNLNEFRGILKGIIASNLRIEWMGQARIDKRMDFDFFKDIRDSGIRVLTFGVESGSNKVLADMAKGITREDVEQNMTDAFANNISVGCMLIIGFPTETPQDFYETLMLIYRIRNKVSFISSGISGLNIFEDTVLGQRPEDYLISSANFGNAWMTEDLKNTRIHRLIRMKTTAIFLSHLENDQKINFSFRNLTDYKLEFIDPAINNQIEYEVFDFNVCNKNTGNNFIDSIFAEIWPLLRILWRTRGGYKITIPFTQEYDTFQFSQFLGCNFTANFDFEIDHDGNWNANFHIDFKQDETTNWTANLPVIIDESTPLSRAKSFALKGLKKSSKTYQERVDQWTELSKLDLTFSDKFNGSGKWYDNIVVDNKKTYNFIKIYQGN